ncbi:Hypothetical predicted protein [Mytilus galloprovincialis]|uniref:Endonuclease/exonuclease/phosphatase domain-containing protein n=1 Tax=Mytilus galloprovincialis TaxID=29158 RepID=A0A8B6E126_MYTGA|nr:Hypothetical predicted protein [Mytilus galloprovincialis]
MEMKEDVDIYLLQEHWLFDCQLNMLNEIHSNYIGIGKPVDPLPPIQMPRGYGGVAILWRKELDHLISTVKAGNSRIQCIEIEGDPNIIIISLYLPCKGPTNSTQELLQCIDQLNEIVCTYSNTHQIFIGGDFNEDIINGASSQRKKCINDFMQDHELSSKETGLAFIHSNGKDATAIDFILYQNKYSENIIDIRKLNVTSNVSDHYPILLSVLHHQKKLNTSEKSQISTKTFNKRIKWDKIDTGKYASLISTEISSTRCKVQNREDIVSGFITLNSIIIKATKVFAPKSNKGKKKPKLQVMNEEIRKAISNKKVAFYN